MNQPRAVMFGLFASLFAVATLATQVRAQAAAPAAPPTRIAVVNLRQVYITIQETVDLQNQLKGLQGEYETMQKSHQLDLQGMQQKITNTAKPGTAAHDAMVAEADEKNISYQVDENKMKLKLLRTQAKHITAAFAAIQTVVNNISKQRGYDLVLVNSSNDLPANAEDDSNLEQLGNAVFGRSVMYVSDKVDITADVIAAMDAAYKSKASGK